MISSFYITRADRYLTRYLPTLLPRLGLRETLSPVSCLGLMIQYIQHGEFKEIRRRRLISVLQLETASGME